MLGDKNLVSLIRPKLPNHVPPRRFFASVLRLELRWPPPCCHIRLLLDVAQRCAGAGPIQVNKKKKRGQRPGLCIKLLGNKYESSEIFPNKITTEELREIKCTSRRATVHMNVLWLAVDKHNIAHQGSQKKNPC